MHIKKAKSSIRKCRGETMISLLVSTSISAFVAAAMLGLMSMNVSESHKLYNRADNLVAGVTALDKMGRLVRMARNIGDIQGNILPTSDSYAGVPPGNTTDTFAISGSNITVDQVENGDAVSISAKFPSVGDPYYGPNGTQNGTIASWPWGGGINVPYLLGQDTLVLQVPTFDANGFPNSVQNMQTLPALDTYVYKVVQDFTRAGPTKYYQLQLAVFPAPNGLSNKPSGLVAGKPITILSGIVGPYDANGNIATFQYVNSSTNIVQTNFDNAGGAGTTGYENELDLVLFSGVIANFQIMSKDAANHVSVLPIRSEMYLRNNASASIMGPAP
jgi:hypothetical protein